MALCPQCGEALLADGYVRVFCVGDQCPFELRAPKFMEPLIKLMQQRRQQKQAANAGT